MLELTLRIAAIMAPSILLASIGICWKRIGPEYPTAFVTTLVLNLGLPALIFHTLVTTTVSLDSLKRIGLATLVIHVLFLCIAVTLLHSFKKDVRMAVAHVVGNTGNVGLPVCLLAFGEEGLAYAITFFSVQCVLLFTIGEAVYAGSASLGRMFKVPLLYALALALIVKYLQLPLHSIVIDTVSLLGQMVVPIMLITLGVSIAGMKASRVGSNIRWSLVRTGIALAIGFGVAEAFSLTGIARGVLVIETVVPVAVFNYLLAYRHNRDSAEVSGLILITHIGALLYLPIVLALVL